MNLISNFGQFFSEELDYRPSIGMAMRFIMLPLAFIWWSLQLFMFTCMSAFSTVIAIGMLLSSIFEKPEDRQLEDAAMFLLLPLIAPIAWWYRYFKYGQYNVLIED